MFEFFSNIPAMFYYGVLAASVVLLILSILIKTISDSDFMLGIFFTVFWPITTIAVAVALISGFIVMIRNILHGIEEDIAYFEEENKDHLICDDNEMIIEATTFQEGILICGILKEHNIAVDCAPTIKWHIFPKRQRVFPHIECDKYKLIFDSVEDKATFQFYWESLKNDN